MALAIDVALIAAVLCVVYLATRVGVARGTRGDLMTVVGRHPALSNEPPRPRGRPPRRSGGRGRGLSGDRYPRRPRPVAGSDAIAIEPPENDDRRRG